MKKFKVLKLIIILFVFISVIFIKTNNLALGKEDTSKEKNIRIESREEKGERFYKSDRIVQGLKIVFSLGVPIIILSTGCSAKFRNVSKGIGKKTFIAVGIYGLLYNILDSALNFPLTFYGSYIQSHKFGLSYQPLHMWLKDYFLNFAIGSVEIFFAILIFYAIIKRSPKRWWIYTGIISIPISLALFYVQPVIIDPLFNDFKTIEDKTTEKSLIELTQKANIENCTILKVDKSKETSMINAYMTGIGKSRRIVLWDTALNKLNLRELRFVTAHEIGHYVLSHIQKLFIIQTIITFIVLYIIHVLAPAIINKFKIRFKFSDLSDVASFPIIIFILSLCMIFITPASNAYSCYIEREADAFAIELTRDNTAAITSFEKLSHEGITIPNPDPLYKMWKYDHPPINERLEFFKKYKPWEEGKKLRYEKYIK
jgi:STE24 endopeptidase